MSNKNLETQPNYRQCTKTVMDTIGDPYIYFDPEGASNYVHEYYATVPPTLPPAELKKQLFENAINGIKEEGKNKRYDCILGLSGGADSAYVAWLAWKNNLRPLVVHFDNGWDDELAVNNIENILSKTGFEYYNYIVDWEEFKDLQLAYLKASVIDIEVVSDQAISAILYKIAIKFGIKTILSGDNPLTERVMPKSWTYSKNDIDNLLCIHHKYGKVKIKTYPLMGAYDTAIHQLYYGIHTVNLLYFIHENQRQILDILEKDFGFRDYKWKHCESVFTRFYQGYILPKKFNVDKRKAHLSNLILSGQMTRQQALEKLKEPYYTETELKNDLDFVCRKLGLCHGEFDTLMNQEPVPHSNYDREKWTLIKLIKSRGWRSLGKIIHGTNNVHVKELY